MKSKLIIPEKETLNQFRCRMIYGILITMENKHELPLPNFTRACKVIIEYYKLDTAFKDDLKERKSKWHLTIPYIKHNIKSIKEIAIKNRTPFDFYRRQGEFYGQWQFLTKNQFIEILHRNDKELDTRICTRNKMIEDSNSVGYNIQLPLIQRSKYIRKENERKQIGGPKR
jgi:hypothetical protein